MSSAHTHTNRLSKSSSPYLLQHAHNPVDWYPWGEEAFERARLEDKPIFLSIGYSTCHWCHVMAHESFEDEEVAKLMNENFICIKVDREERPDIDQLYMAAATTLIGRGGWPLTIVMSPDKRPFFAGTYFPKNSAPGRVGMLDLLPRITQAWNTQREEINATADKIINTLQQKPESMGGDILDQDILKRATNDFMSNYDPEHGGFGRAPKFPSPHNLVFLMREGHRTGDTRITDMALHTLREMRAGGLYDQVGYGFHRYSTDATWHLPHFEKMLYDQATLMLAYVEAWSLSREPLFLRTVAEIYTYLNDKLGSPQGAYYSAEDADSEGEEGKFYVWSWTELKEIMTEAELERYAPVFGLDPAGNFDDEATQQPSGLNVFDVTKMDDLNEIINDADWTTLRQRLYTHREKRVHPGLDNKILTDWNGLTLTALSRAASLTGEPVYLESARALAAYIRNELMQQGTRLLHMPASGNQSVAGFLDDYSFVIQGFRHYYEASFDPDYLELAIALQITQLDAFWDEKEGGFYFTEDGDDELFIRQKEIYDGAIPSGNSVAAENLYYLGRLAEKPEWEVLATTIGKAFAGQVNRAPRGFSALLQTVQAQIKGTREIVIAGDSIALQKATAVFRKHYDPFKLTLHRPDKNPEQIEEIAGFLAYQQSVDGNVTVYVCENYTCQVPVTDLTLLDEQLVESSP